MTSGAFPITGSTSEGRFGHAPSRPEFEGDSAFPLTPAQEALWYLHQLDPTSPAYNCVMAGRIRTDLDIEALQRSIQHLVDRHASLRAAFTAVDGEPVQRIRAPLTAPFSMVDASNWSDDQVRERVNAEAARPVDVADPVPRTVVLQRAADDHVFMLLTHHIVCDFWSSSLFLDELGSVYAAEVQGRTPSLPEISATFDDFSQRESAMVRGLEGERHLTYWTEQLGGVLPALDLPTDRPRASAHSDAGGIHPFLLDENLTFRLKGLARRERVTPYVVLLAAFQVLLHRCSGQDEIVVGSFVPGRGGSELSRVVGYFVNSLPIRAKLSANLTFRELLAQVRQTVREARDHGDYPFALIVKQTRGAAASPIFRTAFNMLRAPRVEQRGLSFVAVAAAGASIELGPLQLESVQVDQRSAQFELTLTVEDAADRFFAFLEYQTDLFQPESIARMAHHLEILLDGIVTNPDREVGELPLLSEQDRRQILSHWNDTATVYPEGLGLHHLFEQQVKRTPDDTAVVFEGGEISYVELDSRANRLAHHLRRLGAGPDVVVALYLDRSPDLVVAILAVLKAGAAFLPLDAEAPTRRIQHMLEDARALICITQTQLRERLPGAVVKAVCLDDAGIAAVIDGSQMEPPAVSVHPDNLVSIYYTSGSTGRPKGVASTHRGWVNRMTWMQRRYQLARGETVLHKTTLTFDDAAVEVFWPLLVGGRVALLPPGLHKDPMAILDAAMRYEVNVLHFVPSMLALFLPLVGPQDHRRLMALRHVISSGEALRPELVRLFMDRLGCSLHNQWGATEVSIDSTEHPCVVSDAGSDVAVSVGRPLANNYVYILDPRLQPVPIGVAGDLYLSGVGLARGYLNDPGRTAEAFIPDPHEPGARMYRTGDRGHYRADGSIMFLGRQDDQVKVRGQRVELGEIETVLSGHPAVAHCAVVAHRYQDEYRLLAYVALHDREEPWRVAEELRCYLGERLPEYMVPGRFVVLDRLPVTASGKINRLLLPEVGDERPELHQVYVPPQTQTQSVIAGVWQEVLGLDRVGIHDEFFGLGGHSLDATRIMSRVAHAFGVQLPLKLLFEAPTVAGLALHVDQALEGRADVDGSIPRLPKTQEYELSHAQQRLWFRYQYDRGNAFGAILTLEMEGELDAEALALALEGLVTRHGILRTTFCDTDRGPRQIVHETVPLPHLELDLRDSRPREQSVMLARHATAEKQTPFDLVNGPVFRTALFTLSPRNHRLVFSVHPIAFDGWSVTVLLEELKALYERESQEEAHPPLPAPTQYVDYAAWQNRRLADGELDVQGSYWLEQLREQVDVPQLPGDVLPSRPQTDGMTYRMHVVRAGVTAKLRALATRRQATLYMTMLTGLKMWLANVSGQSTVTIGSPISGRNHSELESVIGVLWNPVALRSDLSGNPTGLEVLERVREVALSAYANQDYPFDLVLQNLRRRRGISPHLYSVVFVVQNATKQTVSFGDVAVRISLADRLAPTEEESTPDSEGFADESTPDLEGFAGDPSVHYDLHIEACEVGGEIVLLTQYNMQRFHAETVDRFLAQYASVLDQLASDPGRRLSQLDVLDTGDLDDLFADDAIPA